MEEMRGGEYIVALSGDNWHNIHAALISINIIYIYAKKHCQIELVLTTWKTIYKNYVRDFSFECVRFELCVVHLDTL